MATYTVTHRQVIQNVAIVQLLQEHQIEVGQSVTLSGMGSPFDGVRVVTGLPNYLLTDVSDQGDPIYDIDGPIYLNQVQFSLSTADVERQAASGTVTYTLTCTWMTLGQLEKYLGITFTNPSVDYDRATFSVNAANQFAYRRRQESGYFDSSLSVVPSADVLLGTIMYAGALYREAGSIDQFASFDPLATGAPTGGSMGQILRLLGCNRPQVA
jgi:hypothetical protein